MGFWDSLTSGIGNLFGSGGTGSSAPVSYPSDPGGLSNFTAGDTPVFSTGGSNFDGGGGSSWLSSLGSGLGSALTKAAPLISPALSLGQAGLGLYSGIKGMQQGAEQNAMQKAAIKNQQQVTQAALAPGQQLTAAGTAALMGGRLPEGLESQLDQWKTQQLAQIRDYLAKSGQGNSSTLQQWEAYINGQVPAMRAQLAQGLLQPGGNLLQTASSGASRMTGSLQASQQGLPDLISGANKALTSLQALSTPTKQTEER